MAAVTVVRRMPGSRLRLAGWLLLAVALTGGLWAVTARQAQRPAAAGVADDAPGLWAHPGNAATPAASAPLLRTGLEGLPRSLDGTEVDGDAQADAAGHLKPDFALRRLFDYFLSTVGEEPQARVRERLDVPSLGIGLWVAAPALAARDEGSDWNPYAGHEATRVYGPAPGSFGLAMGGALGDYSDAGRRAAGQAWLAASAWALDGDRAIRDEGGIRRRVAAADAFVHAQDLHALESGRVLGGQGQDADLQQVDQEDRAAAGPQRLERGDHRQLFVKVGAHRRRHADAPHRQPGQPDQDQERPQPVHEGRKPGRPFPRVAPPRRGTFQRRAHVMADALGELRPLGLEFQRPQGGYFIWVTLPDGLNGDDLLSAALQRGVRFQPGNLFSPQGTQGNKLRLCFAFYEEAELREGVRRLGEVLQKAK